MGGCQACTAELWGAGGLVCWAFTVTAMWLQVRYLVPAEVVRHMCCACCACCASAQAPTARRGTPGRWTAATRCPTVGFPERLRSGHRRIHLPPVEGAVRSLNVRQPLVSSAALVPLLPAGPPQLMMAFTGDGQVATACRCVKACD